MLASAAPAPDELWWAWNPDPLVIAGLVALGWWYRAGRRRRPDPATRLGGIGEPAGDRWRPRCFAAALATIAVALLSPLDAASAALASAHMVQHVLLVLVAAPLLALSAPGPTIVRGSPLVVRRALTRWPHRLGLDGDTTRVLREPVAAWLAAVAALWFWHAAGPYGAALDHTVVHIAEHATFLATALLFWRCVVGSRAGGRVPGGVGVLAVFAMAMQSTFLSALLTFATTPWYEGYATTTAAYGLTPLADQQLAGAIMWVPAGFVYVGTALALLVGWIDASGAPGEPDAPPRRPLRTARPQTRTVNGVPSSTAELPATSSKSPGS